MRKGVIKVDDGPDITPVENRDSFNGIFSDHPYLKKNQGFFVGADITPEFTRALLFEWWAYRCWEYKYNRDHVIPENYSYGHTWARIDNPMFAAMANAFFLLDWQEKYGCKYGYEERDQYGDTPIMCSR